MAKDKASILPDVEELSEVLYDALFCMSAAHRKMIGDMAYTKCLECASLFEMAYDCRDRRAEFTDEFLCTFKTVKRLCRTMVKKNIISIHHTKSGDEECGIKPDGVKMRMFILIARIDEQSVKWRNSVARARPAPDPGQQAD